MKKKAISSGIPKNNLAIIVFIGFAISFLINFSKFLALFNPTLSYWDEYDVGSVPIYLSRLILFTIFCSFILYSNVATFIEDKFTKINRVLLVIVQITYNIIVAIICFYIFIAFTKFVQSSIDKTEYRGLKYAWGFMLILCFFIGTLLKFKIKQKAIELEKEQLLKYNLQSELKALQNQLDPHFLFNSLNSLNYIIKNLPEQATSFVSKLSGIYRYILMSKNREMVLVNEELDFLSDYNDLIKVRYGTNFEVIIDLAPKIKQVAIPILSLQMLIENAIKHNEVSKEFPLLITIYNDSNNIIVKNKIQQKMSPVHSLKEGLLNLSKRYSLLKGKKIEIINSDDYFEVKLPV